MTYHEYGLNLTKGQADKLQRAAKKGCPVTIRLAHSNLRGDHKMLLTSRQVQKITKLLQQGTGGMNLEMSAAQLKENMKKEGGFLPMLADLAMRALPMVAKTILPALGVDALGGLGSAALFFVNWFPFGVRTLYIFHGKRVGNPRIHVLSLVNYIHCILYSCDNHAS